MQTQIFKQKPHTNVEILDKADAVFQRCSTFIVLAGVSGIFRTETFGLFGSSLQIPTSEDNGQHSDAATLKIILQTYGLNFRANM